MCTRSAARRRRPTSSRPRTRTVYRYCGFSPRPCALSSGKTIGGCWRITVPTPAARVGRQARMSGRLMVACAHDLADGKARRGVDWADVRMRDRPPLAVRCGALPWAPAPHRAHARGKLLRCHHTECGERALHRARASVRSSRAEDRRRGRVVRSSGGRRRCCRARRSGRCRTRALPSARERPARPSPRRRVRSRASRPCHGCRSSRRQASHAHVAAGKPSSPGVSENWARVTYSTNEFDWREVYLRVVCV